MTPELQAAAQAVARGAILMRIARRSSDPIRSIVREAIRGLDRRVEWGLVEYGVRNGATSFFDAGMSPAISWMRDLLGGPAIVEALDRAFLSGTSTARRQLRAAKAPSRPWTEREAARLASLVAEETRGASLAVVDRVFRSTGSKTEAMRLMRMTLGLDERRAMAVVNLYETILANPGNVVYAGKVRIRVPERVTKELAARRAKQYSERLFRQRIRMIAQVARIEANREGQRREWELERRAGTLVETTQRRWVTAADERVCQICEPLDGTHAEIDGTYPGGLDGPPAHPLCRCNEELD